MVHEIVDVDLRKVEKKVLDHYTGVTAKKDKIKYQQRMRRARKAVRVLREEGVEAVVDMDRIKKNNPRPICISIVDAEYMPHDISHGKC